MTAKYVGVNVPLFSLRSTSSWGIGELTDIVPMSAWLGRAGFSRLLLLPIGTMQTGTTSPYSVASTFAIDPIYIAIGAVLDFERAGGTRALSEAGERALDEARRSDVVVYDAVRRAKDEALSVAFVWFLRHEWEQLTTSASALAAYMARERWWLDDYALFQALARSMPGVSWLDWPEPIRNRDPRALDDARRRLKREVLQQQYWQWIAEQQWQTARAAAAAHGIAVFGDLPFVASADSPDVWARPGEFMLDVSAGVPPDAFSTTGQDWGLPTYRWDAIARTDYAWIRLRARRMAALYDGLRVDHAVGLYRSYGRPAHGKPFFNPGDEPAQVAQGAAVFRILRDSGIELVAEDLGVVPDFVRASLMSLGVPGCKVIRWERDWHAPGTPFLDPAVYPPLSATMTGTHDNEPLAAWWDACSPEERAAFLALPLFRERGLRDVDRAWTHEFRDLVLELAYRSGSDEVFLPIQDLFGWRDRINTPGTVGPENWTWCLPTPVDRLEGSAEAGQRAAFLRALGLAAGRRVHDRLH